MFTIFLKTKRKFSKFKKLKQNLKKKKKKLGTKHMYATILDRSAKLPKKLQVMLISKE